MEKKNNVFTITITEKDKVLYDYITQLDVEPDNEEDAENIKDFLGRAVESYKANVGGLDCTSFPSPEVLKEQIKNKKKEELIAIRKSFIKDVLEYASLFNQNLVESGIYCYQSEPKAWGVASYSPVAYITLFANYIDVIDSLLDKKGSKDNDLDSLLDLTFAEEKHRAKVTKKTMAKFVKRYLTPLEAKIIIARYGLESEKGKSLLDLSKDLSMTREKIRQITDKAIYKLRKETLAQKSEEQIYSIK